MGRNLTNLFISESFQYLIQTDGNGVQTGIGAPIASLTITASSAVSSSYSNASTSASYAAVATSSSYAINATNAVSASFATTASYALNAGASVNTGSLLVTASAVSNTITFTKGDGSTFPVVVATGSGGGSVNTGSLLITASISNATTTYTKGDGSTFALTANNVVNASSASVATSASYAAIATSSSYSNTSTSSSYALVSTTSSFAINANSASYALNSTSASYALLASTATTASYVASVVSASYALSASTAISASFATSASQATSASFAISSSRAVSASFATNALSASYAPNSGEPSGLVSGSSPNSMKSATFLTAIPASASGTSSIAIGNNAISYADYSIIIGDGAQNYDAARSNVVFIGKNAKGAQNSVGIGLNASVLADAGVAIGSGVNSNSDYSVAIGYNAQARDGGLGNAGGIAIGRNTYTNGVDEINIGNRITYNSASNGIILLKANTTITGSLNVNNRVIVGNNNTDGPMNNGILAGYSNTVYGATNGSFILAGGSQMNPGSDYSAMIGGYGHRNNFGYSQVFGGAYNYIGYNSPGAVGDVYNAGIFGGGENTINGNRTNNMSIFGGGNNVIYTTNAVADFINNATIVGGQFNYISGSTNMNSIIVGGKGNFIGSNVTGSVVIGGKAITASVSDTVYVPNLSITGSIIAPNATTFIQNTTDTYTSSAAVQQVVTLTQTEYNAIGSPNANTLYIISGSLANATVGSNTFTGNQVFSGSVRGSVISGSSSAFTASLDFSQGNFFTLNTNNQTNTYILPTNVQAGQTINLQLTFPNTASVITFPSFVKQPSGSSYVPSGANTTDILTFIVFNTGSVYLSSIKNMI